MQNQNKALVYLLTFIRVAVGLLFIFSGLVKANDPLGLAYKMGEFFEVFANKEHFLPSLMNLLNDFALPFSIVMNLFEIVAGVALIIGYRYKLFAYLIFILTAFFTFLTAYALFSGNVKECGCFGDCIKLTAMETFVKDVVLMVLIFILLLFRKRISQAFSNSIANSIIIITIVFALGMQWYALKHLPFKDCLGYKIGNNLIKESQPGPNFVDAVYKTVFVYENIQDHKKKEFDMTNYPWEDTLHWRPDTTITTLVSEAKNEPKVKDFSFMSYGGEDVTQTVLNYPGQVFVLFIKDVHEANTSNLDALRKLIADCKAKQVPIIAVSSSPETETLKFKKENQLDLDFYIIDNTACKTAMRSNPGLMLLKAATVGGKWSYADYPSLEKLGLDFKDNMQALFQEVPLISDSTQHQ